MAGHAARLLALLLVLGGPASAAEVTRKKVVVLDFKGPKAKPVQRDVVKLLRPSASIVNGKAFVKAARQVEGYTPDAAGVAKVARSLRAHGIVTGKVTKKGKKYSLTVQVLEGRSGEVVGDGIIVSLKGGKLTNAGKNKLTRELNAVLKDLPDPGGGNEDPLASDDPTSSSRQASAAAASGAADAGRPAGPAAAAGASGQVAGTSPSAAGAAPEQATAASRAPAAGPSAASADEDRTGNDRGEDSSLSAAAAEKADRDARGRALDASAGASFVSRKLTFTFPDGLQDVPQGYDGALSPGIYAAAEFYPAALADGHGRSFLRDVGIKLFVDRVLYIKSELQGAENQSLPTVQTRFGGGLVYRWNFGSSPTNPTLKVSAGYNSLSFTIDENGADDPSSIEIPDVSYSYFDPGLGLRWPVTPKVAILAEARYLYVIDTGQIQSQNKYGSASVLAFDVGLGGELKLMSNLVARAGASYMNYSLEFDGSGDLTDRTDDGVQDITAAKDRYLGLYATAAWLF